MLEQPPHIRQRAPNMTATTQADVILRHLRTFAATDGAGGPTDRQLLEQFAAGRETAFEALVRRHAPLVLAVCRRVLRNEADADDAFQATFLILARKAREVGRQGSVAAWLHRVAYHAAIKVRERAASRERHERRVPPRQGGDLLAEVTGRELLAVLDEELQRLPDGPRGALVLCYLQGHTCDDAARQLGCSVRTLKRRLEQGRNGLRARLARRGIALPAALLALGVTQAAKAAVPEALAAATVKAGLDAAAGTGAATAAGAVADAVLRGAGATRLKLLAVLLVFGVLVFGTALVGHQTQAQRPAAPLAKPVVEPPPLPAAPPAEEADDAKKDAITGRVLDAGGQPVAGAKVAVIASVEQLYRGRVGERGHKILASGEADKEGRFHLECAPAPPSREPIRQLLASARGHGLGWLLLPSVGGKADLEVKLPAEQVIRGRLLDLQGAAAGGVKLHVAEVAPWPDRRIMRSVLGANAPPCYDFPAQPAKLDVWPAAVTTDDDGRFVVRGLGKDQGVTLLVTDERFARQRLLVSTAAKDKPESVERPLEPARWLEGKVVGEDTGKPIGRKVLLDFTMRGEELLQVWADEKGNFRLNCPPGVITIESYPPDGSPYLMYTQSVYWPKGKAKHEVEVKLPRGVLVSGKVTEADSGKPVAGAVLTYLASPENRVTSPWILSWLRYPGEFVRTKDDGTFTATVYPNQGVLMAKGPTRDYVLERLDRKELALGPFGAAIYAHAAAPLDLKTDADAPPVALKLQRGVTIKGRVLDPDGKPVKSAVLYCPGSLQDQGDHAYFYGHGPAPVAVKDGTFTLTGLDPKAEVPVYVLDRKNQVGGRVVVSGKSADEEVTVKLQPCAKAKVRIVDAEGKPQAGHTLGLVLLLAPDARAFVQHADALGGWGAVGRADKDGRLTVSGLIPGATYSYADGKKVREVTAEAGKTHDLGEVPTQMKGGGSGGAP